MAAIYGAERMAFRYARLIFSRQVMQRFDYYFTIATGRATFYRRDARFLLLLSNSGAAISSHLRAAYTFIRDEMAKDIHFREAKNEMIASATMLMQVAIFDTISPAPYH